MNFFRTLGKHTFNKLSSHYFLHACLSLFYTFFRRVLLERNRHAYLYLCKKWGFVSRDFQGTLLATKKIIWINACSGGEIIQIISLITMMRAHLPLFQIVLFTESADVYEYANNSGLFDIVSYSPWDLKWPVRKVLKALRPTLVMAVDFTNQPILFREAQKLKIKTVLLSAMMRNEFDKVPGLQRSFRFQYYKYFDIIGAKSQMDVDHLLSRGVPKNRVYLTGDMKYTRHKMIQNPILQKLSNHFKSYSVPQQFFLAASTALGEDEMTLVAYLRAKEKIPQLKFIIVPRYKEYIPAFKTLAQLYHVSYNVISDTQCQLDKQNNITLIDTFGILHQLYSFATYIYIGSSLEIREHCGGHNPIEALLHDKPIFFGPSMQRWYEITEELKKIWSGCEINNSESLSFGMLQLYHNKELYQKLSFAAKQLTTLEREPLYESFKLIQQQVNII